MRYRSTFRAWRTWPAWSWVSWPGVASIARTSRCSFARMDPWEVESSVPAFWWSRNNSSSSRSRSRSEKARRQRWWWSRWWSWRDSIAKDSWWKAWPSRAWWNARLRLSVPTCAILPLCVIMIRFQNGSPYMMISISILIPSCWQKLKLKDSTSSSSR